MDSKELNNRLADLKCDSILWALGKKLNRNLSGDQIIRDEIKSKMAWMGNMNLVYNYLYREFRYRKQLGLDNVHISGMSKYWEYTKRRLQKIIKFFHI